MRRTELRLVFHVVALLEEAVGLVVVFADEGLHLHDHQVGLVAAVEDVPHGDHLGLGEVEEGVGVSRPAAVERTAAVVAQGVEQVGVEVVGLVHLVFYPQPPFDIELLKAEEAVFERRDALVELLHLLGGVAGFGQHLRGELLIEVVRREVFADVLEEFEH